MRKTGKKRNRKEDNPTQNVFEYKIMNHKGTFFQGEKKKTCNRNFLSSLILLLMIKKYEKKKKT